MQQIIVQAQHGKTCCINLQQQGRQMRHVLAPGAVSTWCEPEHREALGKALEECRTLERRLTKAGVEEAILKIKPDMCGISGRTKGDLMGTLEGLLINLWFPYHDKEI